MAKKTGEDNPFAEEDSSSNNKPSNNNQNNLNNERLSSNILKCFWIEFDVINQNNYQDEQDRQDWINTFNQHYQPEIDREGNFYIRRTSNVPLNNITVEEATLCFEQILGKSNYTHTQKKFDDVLVDVYAPTQKGLQKLKRLSNSLYLNKEKIEKAPSQDIQPSPITESQERLELKKEFSPPKVPPISIQRLNNNANSMNKTNQPKPQEVFSKKFEAQVKQYFSGKKNEKNIPIYINNFNKNYSLSVDEKGLLSIQEKANNGLTAQQQLNMMQYLLPSIVGKNNFIFTEKNVNKTKKIGTYTLTQAGMNFLTSGLTSSIAPKSNNNNLPHNVSKQLSPENNIIVEECHTITIQEFILAFKRDYLQGTLFVSPRSKQWTEKDSIEKIEEYAKQYPDTRTSRVYNGLKDKNSPLIKTFLKLYGFAYSSAALPSPRSKQWHKQPLVSIKEVEDYAAKYPNSRTAFTWELAKKEVNEEQKKSSMGLF